MLSFIFLSERASQNSSTEAWNSLKICSSSLDDFWSNDSLNNKEITTKAQSPDGDFIFKTCLRVWFIIAAAITY